MMALLSTGFPQSLHFTRPISDLSGSAPYIFMSRADSHDVGGEGGVLIASGVEGTDGRLSQENEGGSGEWLGLSLIVMLVAGFKPDRN